MSVGAVMIIVVKLVDKNIYENFQKWIALFDSLISSAYKSCEYIIVMSHYDLVSKLQQKNIQHKLFELCKVQFNITSTQFVAMDCRKVGSDGMSSLIDLLSSSCNVI